MDLVIAYNKPFLSIEEQRALLVRRGMQVENPDEADYYLRNEGYYRLSSYFHPFRRVGSDGKRLDAFVPEANFEDVIRLYEFDKSLRTSMLTVLRSVEISVRVAIAHHLGKKDIFAHENPSLLRYAFTHGESNRRDKTWYQVWLNKYHLLLARDDQEDFVRSFIIKYGQKIPIWVAIEIWDFGLLSRFFGGMKFNDQQAVSRLYGVDDPNLFSTWLRTFNYVRNVCAHHSRLWNRNIVEQPRISQREPILLLKHLVTNKLKSPSSRIYATLALVTYILRQMHRRNHTLWVKSIGLLLEEFPKCSSVSPEMMGFPRNWRELTLWRWEPAAPPQP
ncbi:MAG: Abi family protein [Puniceicoccales bacterium]|nr:Abi family protein [Puniceicoccales bacterium]